MKRISIGAILAAVFGTLLLGGCATSLDMGPGYYHYDTGLAYRTAPAVVTTAPAVVTTAPTVVYREPSLVYHEPTVIYRSAPVF
jgi:hypothetical protein